MNKRILSLTIVALAGCGSFNTYVVPQYVIIPTPVKENTVVSKIDAPPTIPRDLPTVVKVEAGCGIYQLPTLPKLPDLPFRELARVSPSDMDAIDRIQMKHIEELRDYSNKYRHALMTSYNKYIGHCNAHAQK